MRRGIVAVVAACSGTAGSIPSDHPPPKGVASACPPLPDPILLQPCIEPAGTEVLRKTKLTCGGDGQLHIDITDPTGHGGTRFTVVLSEFSRATAVGGQMFPLCPGDPLLEGASPHVTDIGSFAVSFGLTYTGDPGVEPGTTTNCIFQSKVVWQQFNIEQDVVRVFDNVVKGELHKALDKAAITAVFRTASTTADGRCARWREMP